MRISISSHRRILFVVVLFALITQLSLRIDTDSIVRAQSGSPTTAWGLIRHLQAPGEKVILACRACGNALPASEPHSPL
jgi:hypothetical protein